MGMTLEEKEKWKEKISKAQKKISEAHIDCGREVDEGRRFMSNCKKHPFINIDIGWCTQCVVETKWECECGNVLYLNEGCFHWSGHPFLYYKLRKLLRRFLSIDIEEENKKRLPNL